MGLRTGRETALQAQVAHVADEEASAGGEEAEGGGQDAREVGLAGEVLHDRVENDGVERPGGEGPGLMRGLSDQFRPLAQLRVCRHMTAERGHGHR